MDEWWRGPGKIYRELIAAGAKTVMAGHLGFGAYDEKDPKLSLYPPATLSRRLMTDLLRGELGFEGLLVSDAMGMGGVAGFMQPFESYARFLEAGGDCVLFARTNDSRFEAEMQRCLSQGLLGEATLYDRAERMLTFKEDLGLLDGRPDPVAFDPGEHQRLALRVARGAPALVRDREGTLPVALSRESRVLHVVVAADYAERQACYAAITQALSARAQVEELVDPGPHALFQRVTDFDLVVCSASAVPSWGVSVARLHGPLCRNLMEGWMRMGTPVVFVSHVHPFLHEEFDPLMDCVVNLFGSVEASGERLVAGLTGEQPFTGVF
jgi:beta-N-acetylhexosaminidase